MSNHFSAADFKSPGGDARLDLTDLFVFAAPDNPDKTVLIMNANPFTQGDGFHPDAWLVDGAQGDFQWSGTDTFASANIFSIALEAPNDMLGPGPIGTWITTSLRRDGTLVPMDREGNPSFNPILNPNNIKDQFNATDPADDVTNYLQPLSQMLHQHGYPPDEAKQAALTLLPDILHYDRTRPAHYPNGRVMTDDVFSTRMIFMVHGQATSQNIKPHEDLMPVFPFLGTPHR